MEIIHKGRKLTKQQLDLMNPLMVQHMNRELGEKEFYARCEKAWNEAGCPVAPPASGEAVSWAEPVEDHGKVICYNERTRKVRVQSNRNGRMFWVRWVKEA